MSLSAGLRSSSLLLIAGAIVFLCRCQTATSQLAEAAVDLAVPTALEESLQELAEEENQARLNELLALQGVESVGENFGRGLTRGILSLALGASGDETIGEVGQAQMERFVGEMTTQIEHQITPVVVNLARAMTDAFIEALASGIDEELGSSLQGLLIEEIGPAMEVVIRNNIGPALRDTLNEEFNEALAQTARSTAQGAALGSYEGLEMAENMGPQESSSSWLDSIGDLVLGLSDSLGWIFWGLVALIAAFIVAILGWAARLLLQARDIKKKSDLRERRV